MPKLVWDEQLKTYVVEYEKPVEELKTDNKVIPYQDQLEVRRLYGGFPIYNTSTGIIQKEGSLIIIKTNSVSRRLRVRASGITTSVSLT